MPAAHSAFDRLVLLLTLFCLSISSGFLSGRMLVRNTSVITLREDTRPLVPTVHIEGIRNGLLHGSVRGSARVVLGSTVLTQSGVFAVDADSLLINEISVVVPSWAAFVASERGTKYYPVSSAGGQRITPANRIYFSSEQEAENAGYES